MNRDETKELLATVKGIFQNFEISSVSIDIWHGLFESVDKGPAMGALKAYCSQPHEFAPKPGQLLAMISKAGAMTAEEAWNEAVKIARFHRHPTQRKQANQVAWAKCPALQMTIRQFTYDRLLRLATAWGDTVKDSDIEFGRKEFIRLFDRSEQRVAVESHLVGHAPTKALISGTTIALPNI